MFTNLFIFLTLASFFDAVTRAAILPDTHTGRFITQNSDWQYLDGGEKVMLSWTLEPDNATITFELEAETQGYVGFGISPSGTMTGADIFIAGVYDDGTKYFSDRYATGMSEPTVDAHQDWVLLEANEFTDESLKNKTYLKFSRLLNTCDDRDYVIGAGTNRLIWALGATDTIIYHSPSSRGTKSVNLLGAKMPDIDLSETVEWKLTLDMTMPAEDTSYWCSFHKGPLLQGKHHIIAFDVVLPDLNAITHSHHMILYNCYAPLDSDIPLEDILGNYTVDKGHNGEHCYKPWNPDNGDPIPLSEYCHENLYTWAKGGSQMTFPPHVGYPIGDGDQANRELFYMLQIHYDNPEMKNNTKFETGFTFHYTNKTREIDAGVLVVGSDVSPGMIIPPNTSDFVAAGQCGSYCTAAKFPREGINIFNTVFHSHLSGRRMKLRHFRGEQELPWLDYEDHYDFDFQQNKHLHKEVIVLPGDHLTNECTYDSWWKRGEVVLGDLSTRDEMCQSILWYYPKITLDFCGSGYNVDKGLKELGITNYTLVPRIGNALVRVYEPAYLSGDLQDSLSTKFNWTEDFKLGLEEKRRYGDQEGFCVSRLDFIQPGVAIRYPDITEEYEPENVCRKTSLGVKLGLGRELIVFLGFYVIANYYI